MLQIFFLNRKKPVEFISRGYCIGVCNRLVYTLIQQNIFLRAYLLHSGAAADLNLRGAWLHIMGDLLGSAAAVIAGLLIVGFGSLTIWLNDWRQHFGASWVLAYDADYAGQAARCIENMVAALAAAGGTLSDVAYTRVLVASSKNEDLGTVWAVVREAFANHEGVPSRNLAPGERPD